MIGDDKDTAGHGGDAGLDEPDVGQTSTEDLEPAVRDDDIAAGHLGEVGGPSWARGADPEPES